MRRPLRLLGIGLSAVVALLVIAYIGLHVYLNTGSARQLAADQIGAVVGRPVEVRALTTGLSGDTRVELALPAGGQSEPLAAGVVTANVSLLALARGERPTALTVDGATVTLRFDKDGKLLTTLPRPEGGGGGAVPTVALRGCTLTLAQDGRPPFTVSGVDATLTPAGDKLSLTGTLRDPNWGDWMAAGEVAADGSAAGFTLTTEKPARVTMPLLRSIPFVPAETWEAVELDGQTTASFKLGVDKEGAVTYRLDLRPTGTQVVVHPIDLTVSDAAGGVVIDGPTVNLSGVSGRAADGQVKVDADLDFRPDPSQLRFKVSADKLDVKQLPKSWGLKDTLGGRLKGAADLTLAVGNGKVEPRGSGKAVIEGATVAGFPAELVELNLVGDGQRYRFESPPPKLDSRADAAFLAVLLQAPAKAEPPKNEPAKAGEPTYVQANLRLRDVDLAELLKRLNVEVPIRLAGKVSLAVSADIPVTDARALKAYRVRGQVSSPRLEVEGLVLDKLAADIDFRDGVLSLTKLSGAIPPEAGGDPGTFAGTARFGVEPRTDLTADLSLECLPLGQLFKAAPGLAGTASGIVSGKVTARVPGDKLSDVSAMVADGTLTSPTVTVFGRRATGVRVGLGLSKGVARITGLEVAVEGLSVTGAADLTLSGQYPFNVNVKVAGADAVAIRKLVPEAELPVEITGKLDATGSAAGTVSPLAVTANGTVTATTLTVGTATLDMVSAGWAVDPDAIRLSDLKADLCGGTVTGCGQYPLRGDARGTFKVAASNLDAGVLTKQVPSLPVKLDGRVSGTLAGELAPARPGRERQATAALDLEARQLRVNGIPATKLKGKLDYRPGAVGYNLTGDALGGNFDLDGTYPLAPAEPKKEPAAGSLRVTGVRLDLLADALGSRSLAPLRGTVTATVRYAYGADGPAGTGLVEVREFGWGVAPGTDLRSEVRVTPEVVELVNLSGRLADGRLSGRLRYNLANPRRSFFTLTLDRADAAALLVPLGGPALDARVGVNVRGSIGRVLAGSGTLTASRATVEGFPLTDVRLPFDWQMTPGGGAEVRLREGTAQSGGGRVTGRGTVTVRDTTRVDLQFRLVGLSVRSVLGGSSAGGAVTGRLNGTFDLNGSNVRSVNDLTGQLAATFGGEAGGVSTAPVFRALTPYLSPSSFTQLTDGDIRARLANGVLRVDRLTLTGPTLRLYADGSVALSGRLDLAVIARTGQIGPSTQLLRLFRISVPAIGPIPLAVILEVTNFLSNRTVRLRVTGTLDRPAVQVNAAALLAEGAVRYFFGDYLPTGR